MTHNGSDTWGDSSPVPPNRGDIYNLLALLAAEQQTLLDDVRRYLESDVAPVVADHWERAESLQQIVPTLARMNLAGAKFTGYGLPRLRLPRLRPAAPEARARWSATCGSWWAQQSAHRGLRCAPRGLQQPVTTTAR